MAEIAVRVAIEVIKKTSAIVADLVVEEGSRFSRLQEVSWVEREMRRIHSYLKDVEHKQGESERVANLMTDIRDLAFDVEDTMEKYFPVRPKKKGFKGFLERTSRIFSDGYSAHNFLMEIEAIKRRVEDVSRVRQTYGITESDEQVADYARDMWDERRSFPHVDEPNVTGFGDHIEKLIAQVHHEDPRLRVISITGMPGVGKTTLAKKVFNSLRHSIDLTAWVCVSEKPIVKNILKDIAKQVGLQIDKWEDNGEAILFERLSQHRYLIVIDHIWDTRTWNEMTNTIPTNSNNCSRIILTSRNRDVGVHVGGWGSLFILQPLEERYSKQLFEISLGPQQTENDTDELQKIGKRILHRCKGVPLAIVVAVGLLKLKERSDSAWKGVLEQMDRSKDECSEVFALSYTDLPAYLKPCFLYLGIFPKDHQIDAFDLINLWIAEGFVKGSVNREAEDVGEDYLNLLIARNLLVQVVRKRSNGKVESCRIHDILRAVCIQEAKAINFFYSSADLTNYKGKRVRRVTTHGTDLRDLLSSNHRTPKLRSFLCFKEDANEELLEDFPKSLDYLRVAYFHAEFFYVDRGGSTLSVRNWSFRNLTYLKLEYYGGPLCLHKSIIFMESLVTLDLQGFRSNFYFPMAIWNMKRVRHLLLPGIRLVEEPGSTYSHPKSKSQNLIPKFRPKIQQDRDVNRGFDPSAVSFQNFQTLSRVLYTDLGDLAWLHRFSNLRTLKIIGCKQTADLLLLTSSVALNKLETLGFESVPEERISVSTMNLSSYEKLRELRLDGVDIGQWPKPDALPPNLTTLDLFKTRLNGDPLQIMKKIPKLRVFKLYFPSFDGKKMVCSGEPGSFSQLEELVIVSDAVEIIIEEGGMPELNNTYIQVNLEPVVPDRIRRFMKFNRLANQM